IADKISQVSQKTIIFNGSSEDRVTVNVYNKTLEDTLKILAESFDYEFKIENDIFYLNKNEDTSILTLDNTKGRRIFFQGTEDNLSIKFVNQSSKDIILGLFGKFKKQLSYFSRSSTMIPFLDVKDVSFDELLDIIVSFSGQAFTKKGDRYFIYDSQGVKVVNKYVVTESYQLQNLTYKDFTSMTPTQLLPSSVYKIDTANNIITVFGSPDQVKYFIELIKSIDDSRNDYKNRILQVKYLDIKKIKNYLPSKFKNVDLTIVEDMNLFYIYLNQKDFVELKRLLAIIDTSIPVHQYKLKYLKPEDVVKDKLPDYIDKNKVKINTNDSSLLFSCNEETKDRLFQYLNTIDVATPVIRYQLLIVEYRKEREFKFDWGMGFTSGFKEFFGLSEEKSTGVFTGDSASITANFDIPTVFGNFFSIELETKLAQELAKIQLSSEVFGLSGEKVLLKNTLDQHYLDEQRDSDGNVTSNYSSISSGLDLTITGRCTTAEEIYIEISATISDTIPKPNDQPPDKSGKTVQSYISTRSGKPIILGGLKNKKESYVNNMIPGLGQIPIVGNLFKTHDNAYSDTEFIIYIIPFILKTDEQLRQERIDLVKEIYQYQFKKY
ncbi:MAG: hypothetical protein MJB14_03275, partial [Spirochaetes bacterium]|nr:hypothetical protein [Spirochaetota bacterium]